jgi:hypothetical protein
MVHSTVALNEEIVHEHLQIRKRGHDPCASSVIALRPTAGAPPLMLSEPFGE